MDQRKNIKDSMQLQYGGLKMAHRPGLVEERIEVTRMGDEEPRYIQIGYIQIGLGEEPRAIDGPSMIQMAEAEAAAKEEHENHRETIRP